VYVIIGAMGSMGTSMIIGPFLKILSTLRNKLNGVITTTNYIRKF